MASTVQYDDENVRKYSSDRNDVYTSSSTSSKTRTYFKFNHVRSSLDSSVLYACSILSNEIYHDDVLERLQSSNPGLSSASIIDSEKGDPAVCSQTYLCAELAAIDKHIIVAFRAPKNLSDIFFDTTILRLSGDHIGDSFHRGLYTRASKVPVEPFVQLINQGYSVTITGHSFGGSIATLFAMRLLNVYCVQDKSKIQCITFASPFCMRPLKSFTSKKYERNFHHYIHLNDPVVALAYRVESLRLNRDALSVQERALDDLKDLYCSCLALYLKHYSRNDLDAMSRLLSMVSITWRYQKEPTLDEKKQCIQHLMKMITELEQKIGVSNMNLSTFGNVYVIYSIEDDSQLENGIQRMDTKSVPGSLKWGELTDEIVVDTIGMHSMGVYRSFVETTLQHAHDYGEQRPYVDQLLPFTLLRIPTEWRNYADNSNDCPNTYTVVLVEFSDKKAVEVKITFRGQNMSLCDKLKCESAISVPIILKEESTDKKSVFLFHIPNLDFNKPVTLVSHFNQVSIPISSPYSSDIVKSCKEERLSNLELMHLYTYAMSYSLFTGSRNPLASELASDDVAEDGYVFVDNMSDENGNVQYQESQRRKVYTMLKEIEEIWRLQLKPFDEKEESLRKEWNARIMIIKGKMADWDQLAAITFNSINNNNNDDDDNMDMVLADIKFSSDVIYLSDIVQEFQVNRGMKVVDALARGLPYLLSLFNTIYNRELKVEMNTKTKILLYTVGAVVGGGIFIISGGSALAIGGSLLGGIATSLLGKRVLEAALNREMLNNQYRAWLVVLANSLGIRMDNVRSTLYSFESRIYEFCHNNRSLTNMSNQEIKNKWDTIFTDGLLQCVEDKEFVISLLRTVWKHYLIRKQLIEGVAIGIVGESQVGKSYLSYLLFECGDDSTFGMKKRSEDLTIYSRSQNFQLIDFPHIDSSDQSFKACFIANHNMIDAVVVVLDVKGEGRTCDQERIIKTIKQLDVPFLVCFNRADTLFKNEFNTGHKLPKQLQLLQKRNALLQKNQSAATHLTADEIEERRKRFASYLSIDESQVILTCFSNQVTGLDDEALANAGVKNESHVREWIFNYLEANNLLVNSEMQELREYMTEEKIIERHERRMSRFVVPEQEEEEVISWNDDRRGLNDTADFDNLLNKFVGEQ